MILELSHEQRAFEQAIDHFASEIVARMIEAVASLVVSSETKVRSIFSASSWKPFK